MSKILYIGNYLDPTSWGKLCRDYLTILIQEGLDIVARPYLHTISNRAQSVSPLIQAVEEKDSDGATICIQQLPIADAVIDNRFHKNIFIFGDLRYHWKKSELSSLSRFANQIVLSLNQSTMDAFSEAGVNSALIQYPTSLIQSLIHDGIEKIDYLKTDSYKFYTIGKISGRKNIRKLLQAFYLEFDKDENVDLVFKITTDINPEEAGKVVTGEFETILKELGKYPSIQDYRHPMIITGWAEDENLLQLHKSCDCFVSTSWAEYQYYFVDHARACGNQAISKDIYDNLGSEHLIMELNPLNLSSYTYDKYETVSDMELPSLMNFMRYAFNHRDSFKTPNRMRGHNFLDIINKVL